MCSGIQVINKRPRLDLRLEFDHDIAHTSVAVLGNSKTASLNENSAG